jgi:hypothetical protein
MLRLLLLLLTMNTAVGKVVLPGSGMQSQPTGCGTISAGLPALACICVVLLMIFHSAHFEIQYVSSSLEKELPYATDVAPTPMKMTEKRKRIKLPDTKCRHETQGDVRRGNGEGVVLEDKHGAARRLVFRAHRCSHLVVLCLSVWTPVSGSFLSCSHLESCRIYRDSKSLSTPDSKKERKKHWCVSSPSFTH